MNDSFVNSESDPDISFHSDISPLVIKYFNPNEIHESFERLSKNRLSVLHINIRSINKTFETLKHFYCTLNCTFSVICFLETYATDNSICKDTNFQIENYTALHQVRKSGREEYLSIFVHKENYFKAPPDLSMLLGPK